MTERLRRLTVFIAAASLAVSSACSSDSSSPTAPTGGTPSVPATNETFTGTVPVGGSDIHAFTVVLTNGDLNVTLTAAGPPPTINMGIAVGTLSGSACTPISGASVVA